MKTFFAIIFVLSLISGLALPTYAQKPKNSLIDAIEGIQKAFTAGNIAAIRQIFLLPEKVQTMTELFQDSTVRPQSGAFKILSVNSDSAIVLLTGKFLFGNSGSETFYSKEYSGIYVFKQIEKNWKVVAAIPRDRSNQILHQSIQADINPNNGIITLKDQLLINTKDKFGFTVILNHHSAIKKISINNKTTDYFFDGGILWINSKTGRNQKLTIEYLVPIDSLSKASNSGFYNESYGHVRNQYFWHPFFSYASPNDRANFDIKVSIPAEYYLATSIPQKDTVIGNVRICSGKSAYPTFALGLYYDKNWVPKKYKKGDYSFEVYADKEFIPNPDSLAKSFSNTFDFLTNKFGSPKGNYLCVVQDRSNWQGWKNRSNDMIVAGNKGGDQAVAKPSPRAYFSHEVAHGWTSPIGPTSNFLSEGWASYSEYYFLTKTFGDSILSHQKEFYRKWYFGNKYDGVSSIWEDYANNGVSYSKGFWVFYMLEQQLGKAKFEEGLKQFMQSKEPMTIQLFAEKISKATQTDVWSILAPWVKNKQVPHVSTIIKDNSITITQSGDVFRFPLDILFLQKDGTRILKTYSIHAKEQQFPLGVGQQVDSLIVDPYHKLLIRILP